MNLTKGARPTGELCPGPGPGPGPRPWRAHTRSWPGKAHSAGVPTVWHPGCLLCVYYELLVVRAGHLHLQSCHWHCSRLLDGLPERTVSAARASLRVCVWWGRGGCGSRGCVLRLPSLGWRRCPGQTSAWRVSGCETSGWSTGQTSCYSPRRDRRRDGPQCGF